MMHGIEEELEKIKSRKGKAIIILSSGIVVTGIIKKIDNRSVTVTGKLSTQSLNDPQTYAIKIDVDKIEACGNEHSENVLLEEE